MYNVNVIKDRLHYRMKDFLSVGLFHIVFFVGCSIEIMLRVFEGQKITKPIALQESISSK